MKHLHHHTTLNKKKPHKHYKKRPPKLPHLSSNSNKQNKILDKIGIVERLSTIERSKVIGSRLPCRTEGFVKTLLLSICKLFIL